MKNVLVTGGAGFIGYHLVNRLKEDHKVFVLDDYSTGDNRIEHPNVAYQKYCVYQDAQYWQQILGDTIDTVFHLAAVSRVQPSFTNPFRTSKINIMGTQAVLEYARINKAKVIYPASSSKYGGEFESPYAWTKLQGENLCRLYYQVYDVDVAIPRFYNVYGPKQPYTGDFATAIGIFQDQYELGKVLTIEGTGDQRRDFIHVHDIADALILIGNQDKLECQEWELGTGKNYSINEVVDMFGTRKTYIPDREGQFPYTLCTDTRARDLLGWKPKWDLKDYIKEVKSAL